MNQSNGTWRNTESKFWVENGNNGHHKAHWFTWISSVRQLTELVSWQFGKTWRQDAKFLKPGWIIPMGVRVMDDAKFETNASTFQSRKECLGFGPTQTMQQWLLQIHFEDGPHWPRLSPRFCQSSWINQMEPGETHNQNFEWRMPTMAITEHIDLHGFHLWGSTRSLFHDNSARHEDRKQNFWNQVESLRWVSESCMQWKIWNECLSTFGSKKESFGFGRTLTMQQWLLQSHFDDGPHWPRLSPRFCQSSWINQMEPGETQNQNFEWRMPTMAISEHIDLHGFHLWGSTRSLFHDNLARHEGRMQNFWNQVESFPWVSESCMMQNLKPMQAHFNPGRRVLVLAPHGQCSSGSFKAILMMAHIDQDWVQGFANHHESIK